MEPSYFDETIPLILIPDLHSSTANCSVCQCLHSGKRQGGRDLGPQLPFHSNKALLLVSPASPYLRVAIIVASIAHEQQHKGRGRRVRLLQSCVSPHRPEHITVLMCQGTYIPCCECTIAVTCERIWAGHQNTIHTFTCFLWCIRTVHTKYNKDTDTTYVYIHTVYTYVLTYICLTCSCHPTCYTPLPFRHTPLPSHLQTCPLKIMDSLPETSQAKKYFAEMAVTMATACRDKTGQCQSLKSSIIVNHIILWLDPVQSHPIFLH